MPENTNGCPYCIGYIDIDNPKKERKVLKPTELEPHWTIHKTEHVRAENTRSSEPPITTDDLFQGAVLADNRFSRFDQELIDKYFNDDGKAAIEALIASKVEEALKTQYELVGLYGVPRCENLHHPRKYQHSAFDDCPVVARIEALQSKEGE